LKVFVEDPAAHLADLVPTLACAVDPRQTAKVDSAHCVRINYETYFVSDDGARHLIEAAPWKYCGRLTDPVTQLRFTPTKRSPRVDWGGKPYYFASDSTRALFASTPDSFAAPRVKMIGM
jgi:YHS domain-containing protein